MHQIRCPHCGESFTIDEAGYADIVQQIRNQQFDEEIKRRIDVLEQEKQQAIALAESKAARERDDLRHEVERLAEQRKADSELAEAKLEAAVQQARIEQDAQVRELTAKLESAATAQELAVQRAVGEVEQERDKLRLDLERSEVEQKLQAQSLAEKYELQIRDRDDMIERLKELRSKLSTKMIGESLEVHCQEEFNKNRTSMFPYAYFEKDNDARTGSKGDFIFRDYDRPEGQEGRTEILSIMFEMKNETDTNSRKHHNEDFLKELDKDRQQKGCEYAVLVSLLEPDSDLYNQGIVDVSYRYPRMYVVRPQFFLPIISLLRNASRGVLEYKREVEQIREQNIDITKFEERLEDFKLKFDRQYEQASRNFQKVIDEIDKSIDHLQKVRSALLGTDRSLEQANKRAQEITVRKLTFKNPTMQEKFKELHKEQAKAAKAAAKELEASDEPQVEVEVVEEDATREA
ncbi:DUF2130 domain-containing protein [Bifidobacterium cuniculi]|uniref:DUF2130 domain-containing protein n=1 Tax=Bifidobacterium cuniculi TaxID=1688 RepID=A0A087AHT4_9BIFI|nr:DUF2130 domain-containing protein [Bifidobacterium cuniculi]KFI58334.1 hypothetical protein BCUN_1935 [Bifidobacterium cuniculi]